MKTKNLFPVGLFLLLLAYSINTSAQIRLGVKGGFDVVSNKIDFNLFKASNHLGYQIGPTAEFIVPASGFGAEVSLLYGRKEYEAKEKQADATIKDYDYISIPVYLKQRIGLGSTLGVFFTGGVYGNVRVSGGDISIKNAGDVWDEYKAKNFIFGLGAGAGVSFLGKFDLGLYFRGDLTKNFGDEYMDAGVFQNKKNQAWTIGLNYFF